MHTPKITVCMTLRFLECLGSPVTHYSTLTDVSCRCRPRVVVEVEIIESRGYLNKIINLKSPLNLNVSCLKHTSVLKTLKCVTNRMITQEGNCLKPCTCMMR